VASQRDRQAEEETAKAECVRRWPTLNLCCEARYYNGKVEGYVIMQDKLDYGRPRSVGYGKSASDAWRDALGRLDD
jgi:hypothetical protein